MGVMWDDIGLLINWCLAMLVGGDVNFSGKVSSDEGDVLINYNQILS